MKYRQPPHGGPNADPNLIPVMNLFVALIPFLLLAVAFFRLGVIPTTLPTHRSGPEIPDERAVVVSLVVDDEGFSVSASHPNIPDAALQRFATSIPKQHGQYDVDALVAWLDSIKNEYDDSRTLVMLPRDHIPYSEIVRIMDAVRGENQLEGRQHAAAPLFDNVVLSRVRES